MHFCYFKGSYGLKFIVMVSCGFVVEIYHFIGLRGINCQLMKTEIRNCRVLPTSL